MRPRRRVSLRPELTELSVPEASRPLQLYASWGVEKVLSTTGSLAYISLPAGASYLIQASGVIKWNGATSVDCSLGLKIGTAAARTVDLPEVASFSWCFYLCTAVSVTSRTGASLYLQLGTGHTSFTVLDSGLRAFVVEML